MEKRVLDIAITYNQDHRYFMCMYHTAQINGFREKGPAFRRAIQQEVCKNLMHWMYYNIRGSWIFGTYVSQTNRLKMFAEKC